MRAEEVDGGHQHQPGEDAAGEHDGGHPDPNDVAHAEVLGGTVGADGRAFEDVLRTSEVGLVVRAGGPQGEEIVVLEEGIQAAQAQAQEDARGERASTFAGHQDVGTRRSLGVDQGAVLFDDELAAQRDHEQDSEPAAEEREREDSCGLQVEAQKDERGQGEDDAGRDRLAGVADGLDDVVLKDGRLAEGAQDGDGEDRDRDGGGDGEPGAEADVDRDRTEEDGEDAAEQQGAEGELGAGVRGGNEGLEGGCGHRCGLRQSG